jgi:hypothetical protein
VIGEQNEPQDNTSSFREHEFKHASGLDVDNEAWQTMQDQRRAMPHVDLSMLDPGPRVAAILDHRDEGVLFMGEAAEAVTVRLTEPADTIRDAPVVATAEVSSEREFLVGTIVLRMPNLEGTHIAPETIRVFDLGDGRSDPRLIRFSGIGLLNSYVWARICGGGLYVAVGLNQALTSISVLTILKSLAIPATGMSERSRGSLARTIVRALSRAPFDTGKPGSPTRGDLILHFHRQGLPVPFFDSITDREDPEALDRLADRFAANPLLPEIQILMDLDRQRTSPWSG